jgi:hypothetical protein
MQKALFVVGKFLPYFIILILVVVVIRQRNLSSGTTVIFPVGIPNCPVSSLHAAQVFGGSLDRWTLIPNVVCGWSLKESPERISVLIPKGYRIDCWDGLRNCEYVGPSIAKDVVAGTVWKIVN